jgi:hypothetical protein
MVSTDTTDFKTVLWKSADKLRAQMDAVEMVLRQAEVISEDALAAWYGIYKSYRAGDSENSHRSASREIEASIKSYKSWRRTQNRKKTFK